MENKNEFSLGYMFETLENMKEIYGFESYCISQSTLEQIFISMAKSNSWHTK